jgi:hypothetical protein
LFISINNSYNRSEQENNYEIGHSYEYSEAILLIVIQFVSKDPSFFLNGLDKNGKSLIQNFLDLLPKLLYFSKDCEDETLFLLLVKALITIVEMFYPSDDLNAYLPGILDMIVAEIKNAVMISFKCYLLQAVFLITIIILFFTYFFLI